MIRRAFQRVQKRQRRLYLGILAVVTLAAVSLAVYAFYGRQLLKQLSPGFRTRFQQEALAEDLFYEMKRMDVSIANLEQLIAASGNPQGQEQVKAYLARRRQMESDYDRFVAGLKIHNRTLTEPERLILRVTRTFGEYELGAPPEYLAEVSSYIQKWRSTDRFAKAIDLAQKRGYTRRIAAEFESQNLPPQFFYLAMQESDFNEVASGLRTRMGIAKGMWQFIPETAERYGLTVGPLKEFARPDPGDERHHWEKATRAAAKYIKEIYSTDAQGSGLLVMASYNWGEDQVIRLLRSMPANPRERNFWNLLQRHREQVPKEAYDYVLSIVSAAVIGENPRMFGFDFDNPLPASGDQFANAVPPSQPLSPREFPRNEEIGVALFLSGNYARAAEIFTVPSGEQQSPRAHFYLACSRAALVLSGQLDQSALIGARAALAKAGGVEKFGADRQYISPRILQTLDASPVR